MPIELCPDSTLERRRESAKYLRGTFRCNRCDESAVDWQPHCPRCPGVLEPVPRVPTTVQFELDYEQIQLLLLADGFHQPDMLLREDVTAWVAGTEPDSPQWFFWLQSATTHQPYPMLAVKLITPGHMPVIFKQKNWYGVPCFAAEWEDVRRQLGHLSKLWVCAKIMVLATDVL